ncbi:hypothetical protein D9M68_611830 [compost metagenome]
MQEGADEVHAVDTARQRECGLGAVFGGQGFHALCVDIGRVAQHQIPGTGAGFEPVGLDQRNTVLQPLLVDVDAGHGQGIGGEVGAGHLHLRPGQGRQHSETAVAGAQVQHAGRVFAQPGVEAAVGDQLGDEAARHDGALIHIKRHALQPGFVREVGGGLAGLDAARDQLGHGQRVFVGNRGFGHLLQVAVQRQVKLPQHEPGGFVAGVGGAVAIGQVGGFEACRGPGEQVLQSHGFSARRPAVGRGCEARGGRCSSGVRCRPRPRVRRSCGWWRWAGRVRSLVGRSGR